MNYFNKNFKNSFGVIIDDVCAGFYVVLVLILYMVFKRHFILGFKKQFYTGFLKGIIHRVYNRNFTLGFQKYLYYRKYKRNFI